MKNKLPSSLSVAVILLLNLYPGAWPNLATAAQNNINVVPGDKYSFDREFAFYFRDSRNRFSFVLPSDQIAAFVENDARWVTPDGFTLAGQKLEARQGDVTWGSGTRWTTAKGLKVKVAADVIVAPDVQLGEKELFIAFPNLGRISTALGGVPTLGEEEMLSPYAFRVTFLVQSKEDREKEANNFWTFIIFVIVLIGWGIFYERFIQKRKDRNK